MGCLRCSLPRVSSTVAGTGHGGTSSTTSCGTGAAAGTLHMGHPAASLGHDAQAGRVVSRSRQGQPQPARTAAAGTDSRSPHGQPQPARTAAARTDSRNSQGQPQPACRRHGSRGHGQRSCQQRWRALACPWTWSSPRLLCMEQLWSTSGSRHLDPTFTFLRCRQQLGGRAPSSLHTTQV